MLFVVSRPQTPAAAVTYLTVLFPRCFLDFDFAEGELCAAFVGCVIVVGLTFSDDSFHRNLEGI